MAPFWSEEVDRILGAGTSLAKLHVHNWALTRNEALTALDRLLELGVPVLGGDVYYYDEVTIVPSYDNWYCNSLQGEPYQDFIMRSHQKAVEYISLYKNIHVDVLFAIVPKPCTNTKGTNRPSLKEPCEAQGGQSQVT